MPMGMIQRELDKIRRALQSDAPRRSELYAAQQALEWALEPGGIKSPYLMITGIPGGSGDCPPESCPAQSGCRPDGLAA